MLRRAYSATCCLMDRALGPATIKALDHHRVAGRIVRASVNNGETRVTIKVERIAGVSIQIDEFRDFVVADPYGEISGQGDAPAQPAISLVLGLSRHCQIRRDRVSSAPVRGR